MLRQLKEADNIVRLIEVFKRYFKYIAYDTV